MATNDITITLTGDGLGEAATEADFDAWASYVSARIDEACGFSVSVSQHDWSGSRAWPENTITGADEEQRTTIREALAELWERGCEENFGETRSASPAEVSP